MSNNEILKLEDAFYYLSDQINYGDITNMDIYWDGMTSAIQALSIRDWIKSSETKFSCLLKSLPTALVPNKLVAIIEDMEIVTDKSSNDTFEPDELKSLCELAEEAESLFNDFINKLKEFVDAQP